MEVLDDSKCRLLHLKQEPSLFVLDSDEVSLSLPARGCKIKGLLILIYDIKRLPEVKDHPPYGTWIIVEEAAVLCEETQDVYFHGF
jgi:hypothetical protein